MNRILEPGWAPALELISTSILHVQGSEHHGYGKRKVIEELVYCEKDNHVLQYPA